MIPDQPNRFFKDPHSQIELLGNLQIKMHFIKSKKFPNTSAACSNLAKAVHNDTNSLQNGIDDFTRSLEKLLHLLDVFIQEKTNGTSSAGQRHNYSLTDDCEFTILLLWQFRNAMAHNGNVISKKCKTNYEEIFKKKGVGVQPIIDLPNTLETGQEFKINQNDYKKTQACILKFIKKQVTDEDYSIFVRRASTTNYKISEGYAQLPLPNGKLIFNIQEAYSHGILIDPKTKKVIPPEGTIFSFEDSRIHLKNGTSFLVKYIPNSEYDETEFYHLET